MAPIMKKSGSSGSALYVLADCAHRAVLMEAGASPKPGLVCPDHNGAHTDMDYSLFVASANSLRPYFSECAVIGAEHCDFAAPSVFPLLREAGVRAEKAMFAATNGVNTHKGAVFSMGLAVAGAGRVWGRGVAVTPHAVAAEAGALVKGIVAKDLLPLKSRLPSRPLTAGERLFLEHGVPGIRQEAEDGFPVALNAFLFLRRIAEDMPLEKALPQTLLHLMAVTDDTNLLWRGGPEGLAYAREAALEALEKGGMSNAEGQAIVLAMRDEFVRRNLSPGGSADLLALASFFLLLDRHGEDLACA